MEIANIDLNGFDYELPKDRIALFPLEERDQSKLLVADCKSQRIEHSVFFNINDYLPSNSLIIVNATKVIQARIFMSKQTGGKAELLCVNPISPSSDPQITMSARKNCIWECIIGGRNIRENTKLFSNDNQLSAKMLKRYENYAIVEFEYSASDTFSEILLKIGQIPLPPYINRDIIELDKDRYQTVYSKAEGSVAAPTAGLHFTDKVIAKLKAKQILFDEVILHVGPGTFVPIEKSVAEHKMHKEQLFVSKATIENLILAIRKNSKIIATGTTSLRTLETLYWVGVKIHYQNFDINTNLLLNQFEPYQLLDKYPEITFEQSMIEIQQKFSEENRLFISGNTELFILPGYQIRTADGLITNFHLPKSTLLLLISAFVGGEFWKQIYNEALINNYRFLSYGDSSLLMR